ncbi:MAG: sugar lactone lactonase YvrE, partial [Myxococcota bacterium]
MYGQCGCLPTCGGGQLAAVQTIRQRDRGRAGLRGVRSVVSIGARRYIAASESGVVSAIEDGADVIQRVVPGAMALALSPDGSQLLVGTRAGELTRWMLPDLQAAGASDAQAPGAVHHMSWRSAGALVVHQAGLLLLNAAGTAVAATPEHAELVAPTVARTRGDGWLVGAHDTGALLQVSPAGSLDVAVQHAALIGLDDLVLSEDEATAYVAGEAGLYRVPLAGGEPTLATIALPHGVTTGWNESPAVGVDAVALVPNGLIGATWYGGYLVHWDRDAAGTLSNPRPLDWQVPVSDDNLDEDLDGVIIGTDPTKELRLVDLSSTPDGVVMASAQWDVLVELSTTGEITKTTYQGQGGILGLGGAYSLAVSPDGRHLYAASWNGPEPAGFVIGDVGFEPLSPASGAPQRPVDYGQSDVAVAPDGRQVFAVDDDSNALHVYDRDPEAGTLTFRTQLGEEAQQAIQVAVAVTPDGRTVMSAGFDSDTLAVFARDPESGEVTYEQVLHDDETQGLDGVEDIVAAGGARVYVAAFHDASVSLYERGSSTLRPVQVLQDTENLTGVEAIALSTDGRRIVAVSPVHSVLAVLRIADDGRLTLKDVAKWPGGDAWGPPGPTESPAPGRVVLADVGAGVEDVYTTLRQWSSVARFRLTADDQLAYADRAALPSAAP